MRIELTLPAPPSINSYLKNSKSGHNYLSKEAKEFRSEVVNIVSKAGFYNLKLSGRLSYYALYYPKDLRKRDLDNFCTKSVLDALTHSGIYIDDSQIDIIHYERREKFINGKIEIVIEEIT